MRGRNKGEEETKERKKQRRGGHKEEEGTNERKEQRRRSN